MGCRHSNERSSRADDSTWVPSFNSPTRPERAVSPALPELRTSCGRLGVTLAETWESGLELQWIPGGMPVAHGGFVRKR